MARSVTVFRSRLRADVPDEYFALADELVALAATVDGFVEHKDFVADDGERLTLVVFASPEAEATWREHPAHRAAQQRGRERFYDDYDVSVCEEQYRHPWVRIGP